MCTASSRLNVEDGDFFDLLEARGRRQRRRNDEATREAGHLQVWFRAQDNPDPWHQRDRKVYWQILRSWKNSCNCSICRAEAEEKRLFVRRSRYQAKRDLREFANWQEDEL